tara:strand:- start:846 stop:1067 length:222 start_codon:yes stop_codon:yes gene_type:complete
MSSLPDTSLEDFFSPHDYILSHKIDIIKDKLSQLHFIINNSPELYYKEIEMINIYNSINDVNLEKFIDHLEKI